MSKILRAFDNYWGISENGSSFKKEISGGLTSFMTLASILIVIPSIVSNDSYAANESIFIATCFASLVGTLMMTFYSKLPLVQAPGIGLNAYFAFKVIGMEYGDRHLTYANALFIVFISGVVFLLLTIFGIREKIVDSVPHCIKLSITIGIGLFITFVALSSTRLVIDDMSNLVDFAPLNAIDYPFEVIWPTLLVLLNLLILVTLCYHNVPFAIFISLLVGTVLHYIIGFAGGFIDPKNDKQVAKINAFISKKYGIDTTKTNCINYYLGYASHIVHPSLTIKITDPISAFKNWGKQSAVLVFREGWKDLFSKSNWFMDLLNIIATVLSFAMVDMFDTIGALLGTARRAGLIDKDGNFPRMGKALLCDSVATIAGTLCGVATVTTYAESCSGINEGARTGFASLISSICFFIALWLSPLAKVIQATATTPILIYVGVLMMESITEINFHDISIALPAFMTIIMMPFTHNISIGIALGLLTHTFMRLTIALVYAIKSCCGMQKDLSEDEIKELEDSFQAQSNSEEESIVSNDNIDQVHENTEKRLTYKELAIKSLKEIHPITAVIDVLFLIFFFCARK